MGRQKAPSQADRGGIHGQGHHVGVAHKRRRTKAPPELREGQVRCPVCRNGTRTTVYGYLRRHVDLFGLECYNKRPPEKVRGDE